MMSLTDFYTSISDMLSKIKQHPFNQELMCGTLHADKFKFYLKQDQYYVREYAKVFAILSTKVNPLHQKMCLHYGINIFKTENESLHDQLLDTEYSTLAPTALTPANSGYTNYLLRTALLEPVEVTLAAMLPCIFIYKEVALYGMHHHQYACDNPYQHWFDIYTSDTYHDLHRQYEQMLTYYLQRTSEDTVQKMLEAFQVAACYEWHFWEDAYKQQTLLSSIQK